MERLMTHLLLVVLVVLLVVMMAVVLLVLTSCIVVVAVDVGTAIGGVEVVTAVDVGVMFWSVELSDLLLLLSVSTQKLVHLPNLHLPKVPLLYMYPVTLPYSDVEFNFLSYFNFVKPRCLLFC